MTSDDLVIEDAQSRKAQRAPEKKDGLYADTVKIHPKRVKGTIRTIKWAVLWVLLAIYYAVPFVRWDRGAESPDQAILLDLTNRRFYFFDLEIWPQEIYYATFMLAFSAVLLFFVTSLFGRIWCGFACPQTVWTDLYVWVERLIEGDRNARLKLEDAPWTMGKITKRVSKHTIWLIIAALTGGVFVLYFGDAPTMIVEIFSGTASEETYAFVGILTTTTYLLAGMSREQVCTYMCPWPRFQAAMLDEESMVVTYEQHRGEPRGKLKKGENQEGLGDCIDCNLCVAVCPTGIDIRDGIQLECIGCGLCVDACNQVMSRLDRPGNLIKFDTEKNQIALNAGQPATKPRLIRPRTILYGLLVAGIGAVTLFLLGTRSSFEVNILRERAPLFTLLSDGSVRNVYTFKIVNKEREIRQYKLTLEGLPDAKMEIAAKNIVSENNTLTLEAPADNVRAYRLFVEAPPEALKTSDIKVNFILEDLTEGEKANNYTLFKGPDK